MTRLRFVEKWNKLNEVELDLVNHEDEPWGVTINFETWAVVEVHENKLVARLKGGTLILKETKHLSAGQKIKIGVRPENLMITDSGITATTSVIEPTGPETHVVFRDNEGSEITLVSRERRTFTVGETLHLTVSPENMHIFDSEKGHSIT